MSTRKAKLSPPTWTEVGRKGRFYILESAYCSPERYVVMVEPSADGAYRGWCWQHPTLRKAQEDMHKHYMNELTQRVRNAAESIDRDEPESQARLEAALAALEVIHVG